MEKKIEKGFFKDNFMDLIEPMVEDTDNGKACVFYGQAYDGFYAWAGLVKESKDINKWLDDYDGSFTTYVYFYENGKVELLIEYPYDYDGDDGADVVIDLSGEGVDEMKAIMGSEISFEG